MKQLSIFMFLSGLAALSLEMVWLRRLSLQIGSAGLSATITLSIYMAGLGIGALWSASHQRIQSIRVYGVLEIFVAIWGLCFPMLLHLFAPLFQTDHLLYLLLFTCPLLLPPAIAHGATLPAISSSIHNLKNISVLYAINTFGAIFGVLLSSFLFMPFLGIRGTEMVASLCCGAVGGYVLWKIQPQRQDSIIPTNIGEIHPKYLIAAGIAGFSSMSLEIIWSRLGALLIGGSVYAFAIVLVIFLLGISIGASLSKRKINSTSQLPIALFCVGFLAGLGCLFWRWLPHGLALSWGWFGDGSQLPTGALLLAIAMCGAPVASGMVFGLCLQQGAKNASSVTGNVLGANTIGSVLGVFLTGSYVMPVLGIRDTTLMIGFFCVLYAIYLEPSLQKRICGICLYILLCFCMPTYDVAVYATGLYNRINEFVDVSPRAIERFAHEGWTLQYYKDGQSASVAVGQSNKTKNIWLSINGKVDASTGDDMPTQILSGELPVQIHSSTGEKKTLVIGLASGVTAYEAFRNGGKPLTIVELEPAIVEASRYFETVNHRIFEHPDVQTRIADARSILKNESTQYDIIISEPSNPWITGVSNLFTIEYWQLGKTRLAPNGVFCQWVQLYALPPQAFRSLIGSYISVFPNTWLFESIEGSDALLISAPRLPQNLPLQPTLGPRELQNLSMGIQWNTDDRPWIEFEAPKWINRSTNRKNQEIIESVKHSK